MFFLYIFFVHNAHTVDFEIYNIHSFSLKQSRVFFFFFLGIRPHSLTVNVACRFTVRDQKEGGFFFFFFFYKTNGTKNTHTQKHTPRWPTQRRNSKDFATEVSHAPSPRWGNDVTNTDSFVIVVQQRTVSLSFVVVVPLLLKVPFPPLSVNSSELPVASSFFKQYPPVKET